MTDRRSIEHRVELRANGGSRGIRGTAAVFGSSTIINGSFEERIEPGAFDDVLHDRRTVGLFNHNPDFVLGRVPHSLVLRADQDALHYSIPELPQSRTDVLEAIERGDVRGSSFAFTVDRDGEEWVDRSAHGRIPLRIIKRVSRLFDVSAVTSPAYEATSVSPRSADRARQLAPRQRSRMSAADVDAYVERTRHLRSRQRRSKFTPCGDFAFDALRKTRPQIVDHGSYLAFGDDFERWCDQYVNACRVR